MLSSGSSKFSREYKKMIDVCNYFDSVLANMLRVVNDGVYRPKKRGRKSNRYNHYFKARPAPFSGDSFIMNAIFDVPKWSANPIPTKPTIFKKNGKTYINYKPRVFE